MVDHEREIWLELSNHELRRERLSTRSSEEIARRSAFRAGALLCKPQSVVGNPAGTRDVAARLPGDRGTVRVELVAFAALFLLEHDFILRILHRELGLHNTRIVAVTGRRSPVSLSSCISYCFVGSRSGPK